MAWHNRKGPFNKRPGFRMMEIFFLYLGFEIPWWKKAVETPEARMPQKLKYLAEHFDGKEYTFRHSQIIRGLAKGREELIKMTSHRPSVCQSSFYCFPIMSKAHPFSMHCWAFSTSTAKI
jgi:hypothetical protein